MIESSVSIIILYLLWHFLQITQCKSHLVTDAFTVLRAFILYGFYKHFFRNEAIFDYGNDVSFTNYGAASPWCGATTVYYNSNLSRYDM